MKSRLEWKVGIFVFIGLTLLGILLVEFSKGMTFFRPTYTIYLQAPNVGGLKVRAAVLMAGVQVGTVSDIRLAPDGKSVAITLKIYNQFVIRKDALFIIEQSGFLGDQYVAIMPTKNVAEPFQNGDTAQAEAPFNMQEVARSASGFIVRVDDSLKQLNEIIADLRQLVLTRETLTNFTETVGNLREVSRKAITTVDGINAMLAQSNPALVHSSTNLLVFSEQLNQFGASLNGLLATNGPDIRVAVQNVASSTETLKALLNGVEAGKGAAGMLFKDERMANDVVQIARNLSVTTSNLNRLGLWGILWRHRTPEPAPSAAQPLTSPKDTGK